LLVSIALLLTACSNEQEYVEDSLGVDSFEGEQFSMEFLVLDSVEQVEEATLLLEAVGFTIIDISPEDNQMDLGFDTHSFYPLHPQEGINLLVASVEVFLLRLNNQELSSDEHQQLIEDALSKIHEADLSDPWNLWFGMGELIPQPPRLVKVISDGLEHEPHRHGYSFRDPAGWFAASIDELPKDVEDVLELIPVEEDFQIVVQGEYRGAPRYRFHKLLDGEWELVLMKEVRDEYYIFLQDVDNPGWLVNEFNLSALDLSLLETGEYILEIVVSWGNPREGWIGQYFYRFILSD